MSICSRPSTLILLATTVSAVVAAFVGPVAAQSRQDTAEQVARRVEQLHQLMRDRRRAAEAHDRELEQVQRRTQALRAELSETRAAEEERQGSVDALEREIAGLQAEQEAVTQRLTEAAEAAEPAAARMRDRIATGIPFRRDERQQAADHAQRTLAGDDPIAVAEGLTGLWTLLGEELRHAGRVDFWNDRVSLGDGRQKHAYIARLGLVQQLFVSEDGEHVGVAAKQEDTPWRTDLSEDERRQLRRARAILQEREPPQLTPIPFAAPRRAGEEP